MRITHRELLMLYRYCMRDHNVGFNPAWEYLGRSEMQRMWYAFEYFHARFMKKALIETGRVAARTAFSSGMGAAVGMVGGPPGVVLGAAGGIVATVTASGLRAGVRGIISKGRRQYDLYKGRKAAQKHFEDDATTLAVGDVAEGIVLYYLWPGYMHNREPFAAANPVFVRLKEHIYFKPPKSGERLNNYYFSYLGILSHLDAPENQTKFDILWTVSNVWPMLDYLFFQQSFYAEFQSFKSLLPAISGRDVTPSPDVLRNFLFTSRWYFLTRDFYLDHFFYNILPRYELLLNQPHSVTVGSTYLERLFQVARAKSRELAGTDSVRATRICNEIVSDISTRLLSHLKDLPSDIQAACQLFLQGVSVIDEASATVEPHIRVRFDLQQKMTAALHQNAQEYDACVANTDLSKVEQKARLREILAKHRNIIAHGAHGAHDAHARGSVTSTDLLHSKIDMLSFLDDQGNPIAISFDLLSESLVDVSEILSAEIDRSADDLESATLVGGIEGGFAVSADIIGSLVLDGALYLIRDPRKKEVLKSFIQIYAGVRILGGTANFIYQVVSDVSLAKVLFGEGVESVVGGEFLIGTSLVNMVVAYGLSQARDFLYYRMDQASLTIVDNLIVADEMDAPLLSRLSASKSAGSEMSGVVRERTPPAPAAALTEDDFVNLALNAQARAKIYLNSSTTFKTSTLTLPCLHFTPPMEGHYFADVPIVYYEGGRVEPSQIKVYYVTYTEPFLQIGPRPPVHRVQFASARTLSGVYLLEYAVGAAKRYAKIAYDWREQRQSRATPTPVAAEFPMGMTHISQCAALAEGWCRAAECTFLLLNFENETKKNREKKPHLGHVRRVYDKFLRFIDSVKADKEEFADLCLKFLPEDAVGLQLHLSRLPLFMQEQHMFMRLLYLAGMLIYQEWLQRAGADLPSTRDGQMGPRRALLDTLLRRLPADAEPQPEARRIAVLMQNKNPDVMFLQTSFYYNYESLAHTDNITIFAHAVVVNYEKYCLETGTVVPITPQRPFENFEKLGLGLKFKKILPLLRI